MADLKPVGDVEFTQLSLILPRLIKKMELLEHLVLVITPSHVSVVEADLRYAGVVLPTVKTLVVGPYCHFAVHLCPNATAISGNGWGWIFGRFGQNWEKDPMMKLIRAAGTAKMITHFGATQQWSMEPLSSACMAIILASLYSTQHFANFQKLY